MQKSFITSVQEFFKTTEETNTFVGVCLPLSFVGYTCNDILSTLHGNQRNVCHYALI